MRSNHELAFRPVVVTDPVRLSDLFERVKYFESWTLEVLIVPCRDGQPMPSGGRRDVAVFDRHALPGFAQLPLLLGPEVGDRGVEAENPPVQPSDQLCEPGLKRLALSAFLAAHPESQFGNDDGAGIAARLFLFQPGNHTRVAVTLGGLA